MQIEQKSINETKEPTHANDENTSKTKKIKTFYKIKKQKINKLKTKKKERGKMIGNIMKSNTDLIFPLFGHRVVLDANAKLRLGARQHVIHRGVDRNTQRRKVL
jgi:hypothetical protein